MNNPITIETTVDAPIEKVWELWNEPRHIERWAFASSDWEAKDAENDLRTGGRFKTVMAAKDGSSQFDFVGTYTNVVDLELIEYTMDDERKVIVRFDETPSGVKITETFEPESENSEEVQREGWQAILTNFKEYVERSKVSSER